MEESAHKHMVYRANDNLMFLFVKSLKYLNILSIMNKSDFVVFEKKIDMLDSI